jgi:hypothetical protein
MQEALTCCKERGPGRRSNKKDVKSMVEINLNDFVNLPQK